MGKRPSSAIRFGCPRCQTRLFAAPSQAGTKRRCPRCQFVFPVPTAEEAAARAPKRGPDAEYGFSDHPGSATDEPPPKYIGVVCPVCQTRMYAASDQVGQSIECPDCEAQVVVPPAPEPAAQETRFLIDRSEEYPLWGVGQPPPEVKEVYQTYIPVVCAVCHTRMLGTKDQVGQTLVCPDCGTEAVVPPLPPGPLPEDAAGSADRATDYELCTGSGQPAADSVAYQTHIPVICPVCQTRLHATLDQVGTQLVCPDCQTSMVVPPPPKALPKIDPMEGAGEGYAIGSSIRPPEYQPIFHYAWTEEFEEPPSEPQPGEHVSHAARTPGTSSHRLLLGGMAGFLFEPGVFGRWWAFSLGGIVVLCFAATAIAMAAVATIVSYILSMLFSGITGVVAALWLAVTSASLIAVVVDMAAGNEHVENWPEGAFFDWLFDAFYLIDALAVSTLAAAGLTWLLRCGGMPADALAGLVAPVLFPIVLASMLERGSALKPFSGAVWRSLLTQSWAWGLFYLETAVLLLVAGGLTAGLYRVLGGIGVALGMPVLVAAGLLYARLLGRLACVCGRPSCKSTARRSG